MPTEVKKKKSRTKRKKVVETSLLTKPTDKEEFIEQEFYEDELIDVDFNDDIMVSSDEYINLIRGLRDKILNNITVEKDKLMRVYFPIDGDMEMYETYVMTAGKLLTLYILAEPFQVNHIVFTSDFVFNIRDTSTLNNYLDRVIKYFSFTYNIDISKTIMTTISNLSIMSSKVLGSYAVTLNLFDLCQLINKNKEFDKLIRFKLASVKENLGFKEAMTVINDKYSRVLEILRDSNTCYSVLLNSKAGINEKQLKDCIMLVGFKPDEKGYIITEPADNSYIEGNDIIAFYVDAVGGRKALCINKKNTKSSGYLTRKLSLLCIDNYIDDMVDDCGTKQYVYVMIDCQKTLDRYRYRNYVVKTKSGKTKIKTINPETDQHLIGKILKMRSPIKCALPHGKICKKCYGELWRYNKEKNVGLIGVLILTNQNTQLQLSAKHNLQANIDKINWGDNFLKYFSVNREQIYLNEEYIDTKINISIPEFMETDEFDEKLMFNVLRVEENKKDPVIIPLPRNLILNDELVSYSYSAKTETNTLNLKGISDSDPIFTYAMNNNELSASLNNIINLIESHNFIKSHTISEIVNRFIQLLNDSPLVVHGVHIEILIRELCKIKNNDRSLFRKPIKKGDNEDGPIIDVRRVTDAIIKSESLAKSLVYQEQFRQFTQMPETYYKHEKSVLDTLFY